MLDLSKIKLTNRDIQEIKLADKFYRSIDLEAFARKYEDELIGNQTCLFSTIIVSDGFDGFNDLKRVSINKTIREDRSNNRLFTISDLKYPPARVIDKLYYNRASYKMQSIFYGGFGNLHALFENLPNIGDLFTLSTWRQKENTKIHYAEIFHDEIIHKHTDLYKTEWNNYCKQLETLDNTTREAIRKLFSLITFFFIRPVDPSRKIEYLLSAFLSNKIFKMNISPKIEAILYPSVPMEYIATNLAVKPDSFDDKFDFVKAEEFIITYKTDGRRQIIYQKIAEANKIEQNNLCWETSYLDDDLKNFMKANKIDIENFK
jgi:hypothetical protein